MKLAFALPLLALLGCSGGSSSGGGTIHTTPPAVSIEGAWLARFWTAFGFVPIVITIEQRGADIRVTFPPNAPAFTCPMSSTGTGTFDDSDLSCLVPYVADGWLELTAAYDSTLDQFSGRYYSRSASCTVAGPWDLRRQ